MSETRVVTTKGKDRIVNKTPWRDKNVISYLKDKISLSELRELQQI